MLARTIGSRTPHGEGGYALMAVFVISAMLLAIGTIGVRSATMEIKISSNDLDSQQALAVAEAGLAHAKTVIETDDADLDNELSGGGTGGGLTSVGSTTTVAGTSYRFRAFGSSRSTDGYYVRAVDNYDGDPDADSDNEIKIVSRGQVGNAERIVEAVAQGVVTPGGGPGFFGNSTVFTGTTNIDSFNSGLGAYGGTNIGSNGDLYTNTTANLGSGTTINGDLTADTISGTPVVSGAQTTPAPDLSHDIPPACGPPYTTACSGTGCAAVGITSASGSGSVQVKTNGELVLNGGGWNFANGDYCFYQVSTSGTATQLLVNGPVKISLTGKASFTGATFVNPTHLASNLQIISSFVTTGGSDGVKMTGGGDAYAQVYAPGCTVAFTGGSGNASHFYGSIVSRILSGTGNTNLHYDEALGGGSGIALTLSQWREVRNW